MSSLFMNFYDPGINKIYSVYFIAFAKKDFPFFKLQVCFMRLDSVMPFG